MTSDSTDVDLERVYSIQPDEADLRTINSCASKSAQNNDVEESVDPYEVKFDGFDDIENTNATMSTWRKWFIVIIIATTSICVTMISSAWALASQNIMDAMDISREVSVLGISMYIWGLGFGPLFLSPISEFYGRKITFVFGLSLCTCFEFLTEFSPNYGGMLFGRFMSGFFGSCFLSIAGGTVTDIFKKHEIGVPMCIYSLAPFMGPSLGPLLSGFVNAHIHWRWTFHILTIFSGVMLMFVIFCLPETYVPILLVRKAKRIREQTGDDKYYAPLEKFRKHSLIVTCLQAPKRPLLLLLRDPMMAVLCSYTGLALGIVYLFFVAFPYIFRTVYGFGIWQQGLTFMGMLIGMIVGGSFAPYFQKVYNSRVHSHDGEDIPEFRFYPLMCGVIVVPMGLFIIAWTSYSDLHWIAPIIGSGVFGSGVALSFQGVFAYTGDAYRLYAASALAGNSLVRSTASGIFPLFGVQMMEGLGVHWGVSLLAFVAIAMIPAPFYFYRDGARLRARSPYAWNTD
ncbi:YHK8 [Cyberlindnera jadinii]|uniref:YHK8 protein n=1 Tax=Cyberlindnera jadinii (strain ATCC 18201 / CBS 1600 / BCRC 20928 / JCM 3617 / NBRC 0987 / NRRL Y-1542) TaxID=983966 RepID=A0A0H5BYH0_CYBJN|nr:YHK8 [Cyberlindnera jadinii]